VGKESVISGLQPVWVLNTGRPDGKGGSLPRERGPFLLEKVGSTRRIRKGPWHRGTWTLRSQVLKISRMATRHFLVIHEGGGGSGPRRVALRQSESLL